MWLELLVGVDQLLEAHAYGHNQDDLRSCGDEQRVAGAGGGWIGGCHGDLCKVLTAGSVCTSILQ